MKILCFIRKYFVTFYRKIFSAELDILTPALALESEFINWYDAKNYCNQLNENAFLAEIRDQETQLVIAALADELPDHAWWLGATDFYQVKCLIFDYKYFQLQLL